MFSPVEEARFFYNALEIKDFSNIGKYNKESIEIQKLAKDLPASAFTISKIVFGTLVFQITYFFFST